MRTEGVWSSYFEVLKEGGLWTEGLKTGGLLYWLNWKFWGRRDKHWNRERSRGDRQTGTEREREREREREINMHTHTCTPTQRLTHTTVPTQPANVPSWHGWDSQNVITEWKKKVFSNDICPKTRVIATTVVAITDKADCYRHDTRQKQNLMSTKKSDNLIRQRLRIRQSRRPRYVSYD